MVWIKNSGIYINYHGMDFKPMMFNPYHVCININNNTNTV